MLKKLIILHVILAALVGSVFLFGEKYSPAEEASQRSNIDIVLEAGHKVYPASVPAGSSVFDAMKIIASSTDFRFKAKYYPSLGYFIEEINGVANSRGEYWTLYVNGRYSTVGASNYELKSGDIINWKFESK